MFDNVHEAPKKSVLGWFSEREKGGKGGKMDKVLLLSLRECLSSSVTLWPRVSAGCQHPNFTFYTPSPAGLQGFRVLPPGRHGSLPHLLLLPLFDSATRSALNHLRLPATKQAH